MNAVFVIAGKEFRDGLRNRWFLGAAVSLTLFALSLIFIGSSPAGTLGVDRLSVTVVSLASLSVFLIPLMALLLSFDALVGEHENGTLSLLLSYPVGRWQVILGKFAGQSLGLGLAALCGYIIAGITLKLLDSSIENWLPLVLLTTSSILLGAVFIAVGLLLSAVPRARGAAAGLAVIVWLVFVVLYDMVLLGILVSAGNAVSEPLFNGLLLANPTDAFRLINLAGFEDVRAVAGLSDAEIAAAGSRIWPLVSMLVWLLTALAVSMLVFRRKSI